MLIPTCFIKMSASHKAVHNTKRQDGNITYVDFKERKALLKEQTHVRNECQSFIRRQGGRD